MAGAVAAIIYDETPEILITMGKPPDNPDPSIPSIFVSQRSGMILKQIIRMVPRLRLRILPNATMDWISALAGAVHASPLQIPTPLGLP